MTNTFLEVIQPESNGHILEVIDEYDIFNNPDNLARSMNDWKIWVKHYIGFVICAILGILFIILMPIVGCTFCLCRCCGNCGGKPDLREHKRDGCKRVTCGIILAVITTFMMAGMICAFVTNELIRQQTSQDEGLLRTVYNNIEGIESYRDETLKEIEVSVVVGFRAESVTIMNKLEGAPLKTQEAVSEITDSSNILESAESLAASAETISASLGAIKSSTDALKSSQSDLEDEITSIKADVLNTIRDCTIQACLNTKGDIDELAVDANFSNVATVEQQLQNVQAILDANLAQLVQQGIDEYNTIITDVGAETRQKIDDVQTEIDNVGDTLERDIADAKQKIHENVNFNGTKRELLDRMEDVETYGDYRWYAGIGLSCVLLLIIVFNYLGLCFGFCGESPEEGAGSCNKGVGANLLMAGVGFCFIFSWLLMLVTLLLFLGGGMTHTESCRYIVDMEDSTGVQTIDRVLQSSWNGSELDYSVNDILTDCKNNKALYQVMNLDDIYNLTEILDIDQYVVKDRIHELDNIDVDTSDVDILSADTKRQLENLANADLDGIDFNSFYIELEKELVNKDLEALADDLSGLAEQRQQNREVLIAYANRLRTLQSSTISRMLRDSQTLKTATEDLETELYGTARGQRSGEKFSDKTNNFITQFEKAELNIQENGTRIIKEFIRGYAQEVYTDVKVYAESLQYDLKNNVGRCRPLYIAVDSSIQAVCVTFLDPFNGFWFSFGWTLFFFIPSIIFSVKLAGLYRKTDEYYDDNKSFDDPNYDAYTGAYPGDNIPLEDVNRRKKSRGAGAGAGHQNAGYQPDIPRPHNGTAGYPQGAPPGYGGGGGYPSNGYPPPPNTSAPNPPHYYNNRTRQY